MPKVVADVIPLNYADLWQMESHCGRCCSHLIRSLADVIAKVAEGIATLWDGRCYCHCGRSKGHIGWNDFNYGRWNSHWVNWLLYFIYLFIYRFISLEEHEHLQKVLTICKYPRWASNRTKNKSSVPVQSKVNNNKKNPTNNSINSNIKRNYIVVPYIKGLSESIKIYTRNMAYNYTLKGAGPSKTSWWHPKTKTI